MFSPSTFSRIALCLVVMVSAGCSNPVRKSSVWDNYDVRHETQSLSAPYIDNDAYYAPPDCSIMDAPSCGGD